MDWKKISIIGLDILIGVYLVLAMTAFNKPDERKNICHDVRITISQETTEGFLNESDVQQILRSSGLKLVSQPMSIINTRQIEELLQSHDLIDKVECYKAINGVVCINIQQRIPIVHIMTPTGEDYYVDNHNEVMKHSNYTCNLIVATGNISKPFASKVLAPLVKQINENNFWKNQIVQINVLDDHSIEVVPRVGDHIVYLGKATNIPEKLDRLKKFYCYGLSKAGWNRYSRINVEFDNQIICKRKKLK